MDGSTSHTVLKHVGEFLSQLRPGKVVIACSGGPDSVALARAACEAAPSTGTKIVLAHVNHRLRGRESEADARFVLGLGKRLGVPARVFARPVRRGKGNLEERARDARYDALCRFAKRLSAPVVLTAHTLDDQAETVMLNLVRGCGTDGLAGMSANRKDDATGVTIGRPFLGISRAELVAFLKARRQAFRRDSSNADLGFLRNYFRIKVFNDIERRAPGFKKRLARLAHVARDEQAFWEEWTEKAARSVARARKGGRLVDGRLLRQFSPALQRRVLRRLAGRDLLTFDAVEKLRAWMETPPSAGRIWQLRKGWIVERLSKTRGSPTPSFFLFRSPAASNGAGTK
jgi:tRNA(Ile)-lysidine synthase